MAKWGKRKDGQAYQKKNSTGIKSSSTSPVADIYMKGKHHEFLNEVITRPSRQFLIQEMRRTLAGSKFTDNESERKSFDEGFDRGVAIAIAVTNDTSKIKIGMKMEEAEKESGLSGTESHYIKDERIENMEDLKEFYRQAAFAAEENDREYSPFEFQAKVLRDRETDDDGNQISDSFDAFDEGIALGIGTYLEEFWKLNLRGR